MTWNVGELIHCPDAVRERKSLHISGIKLILLDGSQTLRSLLWTLERRNKTFWHVKHIVVLLLTVYRDCIVQGVSPCWCSG
jgi:hypothetical protein